jgi:hypothetical protein
VKDDLLRYGIQLEEHGGDTQVVEVSAVTVNLVNNKLK